MEGTTATQVKGLPVYGSTGEELGNVDVVFDDEATGKPEWLAIGTGMVGRERRLVPYADADVRDDGVRVPYTSAQVGSTPVVEGDQVSQERERELYAHYGLRYSERRSGTGLPEGREQRDARRQAPRSRPIRGGSSDEPTRDELYEEAKRLGIEGRSRMRKRELARAVERARGKGGGRDTGRANPIEVQKFLDGVGYPAQTRELVEEARRQGANERVRATLERLPDERFETPTEVSEAIGRLG